MGFWGTPITVHDVATDPIDTDRSTTDTIVQMRSIALQCAGSPIVVDLLDSLIRELPRHPSNVDVVRKVFWWIKNHITFEEDETILGNQLGYVDVMKELLIPPVTLLQMQVPMGDCDDFSMLFAALMVAAKIPVWFVTVAVDAKEPFRFSHVYCKVMVERGDMPIDCSHGKVPGWETDNVYRRIEWFVG